jgi:hypothetical protein
MGVQQARKDEEAEAQALAVRGFRCRVLECSNLVNAQDAKRP